MKSFAGSKIFFSFFCLVFHGRGSQSMFPKPSIINQPKIKKKNEKNIPPWIRFLRKKKKTTPLQL